MGILVIKLFMRYKISSICQGLCWPQGWVALSMGWFSLETSKFCIHVDIDLESRLLIVDTYLNSFDNSVTRAHSTISSWQMFPFRYSSEFKSSEKTIKSNASIILENASYNFLQCKDNRYFSFVCYFKGQWQHLDWMHWFHIQVGLPCSTMAVCISMMGFLQKR